MGEISDLKIQHKYLVNNELIMSFNHLTLLDKRNKGGIFRKLGAS